MSWDSVISSTAIPKGAIVGEASEEGGLVPRTGDDDSIENFSTLGQGTLCQIILASGSEWAFVGSSGDPNAYYEQSFELELVTRSTVLNVTALTRSVLPGDLLWVCDDGVITFRVKVSQAPEADIVICGYLFDTGDPWQATGVIEARPGASWAAVTYKQGLHDSGWSVTIPSGSVESILTPVSFANARLLFATFMGVTGAEGILCTRIGLSGSGYLQFTLFNAGGSTATITDADIRILYDGRLTGFVADSEDDETVAEYISYRDFAEI